MALQFHMTNKADKLIILKFVQIYAHIVAIVIDVSSGFL
jgi:hypothetical protein